MPDPNRLSHRERQIMDVIYALGEASAAAVVAGMGAEAPTRDAIRTFLRILEQKGHVTHRKHGREFIYRPTHQRQRVGRSALRRVLSVFFDGSVEQALAAHLTGPRQERPTAEELQRLMDLIQKAKREEV